MEEIIATIVVVVGALLMIAVAIVKLTPSEKDDKVVAKIKKFLDPILSRFDTGSKKE